MQAFISCPSISRPTACNQRVFPTRTLERLPSLNTHTRFQRMSQSGASLAVLDPSNGTDTDGYSYKYSKYPQRDLRARARSRTKNGTRSSLHREPKPKPIHIRVSEPNASHALMIHSHVGSDVSNYDHHCRKNEKKTTLKNGNSP